MNGPHTCAHTPCKCAVTTDAQFCSDYCRKASTDGTVPAAFDMTVCVCGHIGCMHADSAVTPASQSSVTSAIP